MTPRPIFKSEQGRQAIVDTYDSILTQWPLPYEGLTLSTPYGSTFAIACGPESAPPLILLHGSSSNSAMWIGDVNVYCRSHRVYAVDVLGEPGKSEAVRLSLEGPDFAEWMKAIYAELHLEQAALLGISLGAWIALKFATTYPSRVEKLVLLCPSGIDPQKASFMLRAIPCMLLGRWGRDRILRLVNGNQEVPIEAVEYSRLIADSFNPIMETMPIFSDEDLCRLTMPVLLIAGGQDVLLDSRKTVERMQALLPGANLRFLPDAGHVLINLAGQIEPFLQA